MIDDAPPARWRLWFGAVLAAGLGLRAASILSLPIFNDEAVYGLWVRSILGPRQWLISYSDGKQPLFYWLAAFMTGIVNDPLLGLRAVAALAGLAGMVGVYLAAATLADRRAGLAAAWLYAIIPYTLIYDRLGLPDGLLAAVGPYVFLAAVKLGREPGRRRAVWLGAAMGLALLVKTTAVLFIVPALLGTGLGLWQEGMNTGVLGGKANRTDNAGAAAVMAILVLAPALLPSAVLAAVAPAGSFVVGKSSSFLLTAGELGAMPFKQWSSNLGMLWRWFLNYAQWPVAALIAGGFAFGSRRYRVVILVSLAAAAGPTVFMALAARTWFSRYAVMAVPFLVLAGGLAYSAMSESFKSNRTKQWAPIALLVVVSVIALGQDILLIGKPLRFAWVPADRWQYIEGWPSGYGLSEALRYVSGRDKAAHPGGFTVLADANMGFPKDALLNAGLKARLKLVDGGKHLPPLPNESGTHLYIVDKPRVDQPDFARTHRNWALVATFQKPGNHSSWQIYEFRRRPKLKKRFKR